MLLINSLSLSLSLTPSPLSFSPSTPLTSPLQPHRQPALSSPDVTLSGVPDVELTAVVN